MLGLRGLSIEGRAREILERLGLIQTRLDRFADSFDIAVRHLGNAHRQAEEAGRRLARLESAFTDLSREPEMTNGAGPRASQKRNDSPA